MKKVLIISVLSLFCLSLSYGQNNTSLTKEKTAYRKNIYVEGLGASFMVGINYDMRLQKGRNDGLGFRAGLGFSKAKGSSNISDNYYDVMLIPIPLELNYLMGKNRHHFISGVGILPGYLRATEKKDITSLTSSSPINKFNLIGAYATLGYRFQPTDRGLMFQINWNPMLLKGGNFSAKWIGVGIGYGF